MSLERQPVAADLLTAPLDDLGQVHLRGTRCPACGETAFGRHEVCPNCAGPEVREVVLGDQGALYSFTIIRHRPPGGFAGADPFKPFGVGLVELDDGVRVMAPLRGDPETLKIGQRLVLEPFVLRTDDQGREVIGFAYRRED